jgi:hypothetical protein
VNLPPPPIERREGPSVDRDVFPHRDPEDETNPDVLATLAESEKCVVCMERPKITVTQPCRHQAMCKRCTERVLSDTKKCPVCRERIVSHIYIYRT